jgi:hypothetical protein
VADRFSKAVIEYSGRGRYLYSCDSCSKVTTEVVSMFFGEHGEKMDLCRECLDADGWGRALLLRQGERPSRQREVW